jgi:hypothetical protein
MVYSSFIGSGATEELIRLSDNPLIDVREFEQLFPGIEPVGPKVSIVSPKVEGGYRVSAPR